MAAIDARGDDVVLELEDNERSLMLTVFTDLAALLAEDDNEDGRPDSENWEARLGLVERPRPQDPALLRLFPDVDPLDEERSREFRRLTEFDLQQAKAHNVRIVLNGLAKGSSITLNHDEVLAWMKGLNDLRLVLAVRMGIDTEEAQEEKYAQREDLDESEELTLTLYDFLTWIQDRLTTTLLSDLPGDDDV
ncbi:MAG: DUF2017 family protein [Brevibacterium aurantiacum]|uniref:DUF2017 domain-containing protein n=1 Tax=Brevibacterium aurantiacum TaxID=273384 RepID=A0A1D7W1W6_BREAU|nr:DUF2017 family protein [Brevibacterium aurantiacum]AOP52995.1 DUF2017 domain-containing protein [Brevibacterium aurantiacum]AZL05258.1 DUF2017 domain-containing protein [Brevibacterium aurantiacum]AZT92892.1 DUF2017 domain-containing protein [Brevibacterium aurantiacum]PCC44609.1 DUF2017 domain-containing protein [Brevibacterium aurantiacum]PCC47999.1 DUF2017 domain-containing protein [Brevibacterium aurantiacum]